jgi:poly(3-hydroxybutyrate) depolymerase
MFREVAPTQVENRGITMTVVQAAKRDDAGLAGLDPRLIAEPGREPAWGGLAIDHTILGARRRPIESRHISLNPFSVLLTLRVADGAPRPLALLVMPMSGGHALMMRDLAAGLLETHDVALLDWVNARYVPLTAGRFGFQENVETTIAALRHLGAGVHLVGICQSGAVAALAASALHQAGAAERPVSLALLSSPIEPLAEQTRVSSLLAFTARSWLTGSMLSPVPRAFAGRGRMVYPAELQQARLKLYLKNQLAAGTAVGQKITHDDGLEAERFPFLERATRLKDISGPAFTESVAAIYHDRVLWSGGFRFAGEVVGPRFVKDLAVMTIEAEGDDITAPGQTVAAHRLFARVPDGLREHLLLDEGSHFSAFHGRPAIEEVAPALSRFMTAVAP